MPKAGFQGVEGISVVGKKNVITTHLLLTGWSSSSPAYAHCPLLVPCVLSMEISSFLSGHIWPPFRSCSDVTFSMKPSPLPNSPELSSSKLSLVCKFILCCTSQASYVLPSWLQLECQLQEGEHPTWWWKRGKLLSNPRSKMRVQGFNVMTQELNLVHHERSGNAGCYNMARKCPF